MSDRTPLHSPTKRITVRDDQLTIAATGCMPRRGGGGAVARELAGRGVHLADIHLIEAGEDPNELVVRFLFEGSAVDQAKDVIVNWALATGYARVWFRDELCDLTDVLPPTGRVSVSCPTCSAHWAENDLEFWEAVREHGGFPNMCPACGGTLPQWTPRFGFRRVVSGTTGPRDAEEYRDVRDVRGDRDE